MTAPDDVPGPGETSRMEVHVSHEMERLLWIGDLLRRWRWLLRLLRQDTMVRALRVAYAAHARAVLEFYHDGRLDDKGNRRRRARRDDNTIDVQLHDYTGGSPGVHAWVPDHKERLADADKLLAHLSTGRLAPYRATLPEWGDAEDRARFRQIIGQITRDAPARFPEVRRALARTRS